MDNAGEQLTQQIEAARLAESRDDRSAVAEALIAGIETTRSKPELQREHVAALIRLGTLERERGRLSDAERHFTEAISIGEQHLGAEHPSLSVALNELSRLHIRQSDYSRAEPVLLRLLQIVRVKGDRHPDVATALAGLAVAKRGLGDDAAAERLYRHALRIREEALSPSHMAIVVTLEQLSATCAARGNVEDALAQLRRALPIREHALGAEHATVRALRARIAELEHWSTKAAVSATELLVATTPVLEVVPVRAALPIDPAPAVAAAPTIGAASHDIAVSSAPSAPKKRTMRYSLAAAAVAVLAIAGVAFGSHVWSDSQQASAESSAAIRMGVLMPASTSHATAASGANAAPTMPGTQPVAANDTAFARPNAGVALPRLRRLVVPKVAMPNVDSLVRISTNGARDTDLEPIRAPGGLTTPTNTDDQAVIPPVLLGTAPIPHFPDQLRAQRLEGEVVVRFRVTEKGRVDQSSMQVLQSPHALFTESVRNALPNFRFEPARSASRESMPQSAWVQFSTRFAAQN